MSKRFLVFTETHGVKPHKYFIMTSGSRWIKNNLRAVIALDEVFTQRFEFMQDFKVVVTGVVYKKMFEKHIKNKEYFVFLDYVERSELEELEKNAYAFIYPTLNEGFGYPPIESMKYGVPVIASGTSSIPEVCGNAVLYFDPYSISEIKNRIIQLMDRKIYDDLKKKSAIRYKEVSEMQKTDLEKLTDFILE